MSAQGNSLRFFLHGAPGDIMVGLGNALHHPQWNGDAVYYGKDHSCVEFIQAQGFKCQWVKPRSDHEYGFSVHALCVCSKHHPHRVTFMNAICKTLGIEYKKLLQFQISIEDKHRNAPQPWKSRNLPLHSLDWAQATMEPHKKPWVVVHPYSFQSNPMENHWPHWEAALKWLAERDDATMFLTGVGWEPRADSIGSNTVNLVGKTSSNNDVLALQLLADLTVTTSNNLSHFAAIADKPTITCINKAVENPNWYFRKAYVFPGATFIERGDPLRKLQKSYVSELLKATDSRELHV